MTRFWKQFSLSAKFLIIIFGLVGILAAILTASFINNNKTINSFNKLLENEIAIVSHAKEIRILQLECRRNEKDFMLRNDLQFKENLIETMGRLREETNHIIELASGTSEPISQAARDILSEANRYLEKFDELAATSVLIGLDPDSGLRKTLKDISFEIAADLKDHQVEELYIPLLQMRKLEKEFLRTHEERLKNKLTGAMKYFRELATDTEYNVETKAAVLKALDTYQKLFDVYQEGQENAYDGMIEAAVKMENSLGSIYVPGAKSLILAVKSYEKNYLLSREQHDLYDTLGAIESLVDAYSESLAPDYLENLQPKTDQYKKTLLELAANDRKNKVLLEEMRNEAHAVEKNAKQIIEQASTIEENKLTTLRNNIRKASIALILIALAVTGLSTGLVILTVRALINSIRESVTFAEQVGDGDLRGSMDVKSKDETGQMISALNKMVDKLNDVFRQIIANAEQLSASSNELSGSANRMSTDADSTLNKTNRVTQSTEEMSSNMQSVAAASKQAASNVNIVASAVEEMSSTVREIAKNTEQAHTIAKEAVSLVTSSTDKVNQLGVAASEISKVTEAITEISEQTNLLALNATIEAARAGEAGKGFAVVANEIKELARQTALATQEIKIKVEAIQGSTNETVQEIQRVTGVITDMNDIVSTITAAVHEQASTTSEIADNITQAAHGIREVDDNVSQTSQVSTDIAKNVGEVREVTEQTTLLSSGVSSHAVELAQLAEHLKKMVHMFKIKQ